MLRAFFLVLLAFALSGCASSLQGRVSRFHALDSQPRTFVIVPAADQEDSLEFKSYAALVASQLTSKMWRQSDFGSAEIAVSLQYAISQGREVAFSYPIFGQVPTGRSTTFGSVSSYGSTATYSGTTTNQTTLGVVGSGVGSDTEFDRVVQVIMYDLPKYRSSKQMERLYEGRIRSTGSTGDLPTVMPALVRALFEKFPGVSGSTQRVTAPIKP